MVSEFDAELVFQLSLSCAVDAPTTVTYSTVDGSAAGDLDFTASSFSTSTFGVGEVSSEIRIPVLDDSLAEPAEHFFVVLGDVTTSAAAVPVAVDPEAIGVILDDDVASGCVAEPLALAGDFNVFVFGHLIQNYTDADGRVAVGGTAQFQGYEVGGQLGGGVGSLGSLVVGGSVIFSDGTVRGGDLVHGGTAQLVRVNIADGQAVQGTPIDFAAEQVRYESMSATLAMADVNGVTDVKPWGSITLTGTDAELNVFSLPASDLAGSVGLTIDVPAGSTALINVDGAAVTMQNFGFSLQNGADRGRVIFNLYDATSLTMQGIGVEGSVLAPFAAVQFSNGDLNGSLVADSIQGSGHFNHHPFTGCLPTGGAGAGGDGDDVPDFVISDGVSSRPALSVGDVEVFEADTEDVDGLVRLESSHPSSLMQSAELLLVESTALADVDFSSSLSGTRVELAPGERVVETPVTVLGDTEPESDEIFYLLLDRPQSAVLGGAFGSAIIVDNDEGGGGGGSCVGGPLGSAGDYNVFVFGSVNQANGAAEGRLAAGGHLQLANYSIGVQEPAAGGDVLVAGQSLIFSNGQVYGGDIVWGTTAQLQNVQISGGVSYQGSPIDFTAERTAIEDLSASLASLADTGTATIPPWNAITLEGTDPELNVFSVPSSTLSAATSFTIRVPAGSTALVNVSGVFVTMQNFGFSLDGAEAERIVFNLHQSTSAVVQNIALQGLLLAPHAAVQFNNGQHNGALIAASLQGNGQSNRHLFEGCLPLP